MERHVDPLSDDGIVAFRHRDKDIQVSEVSADVVELVELHNESETLQ